MRPFLTAKGGAYHTKELATLEVSLSEKMLMFLQDNFRGRIEPDHLSNYYDLRQQSIDLNGLLEQLSRSSELNAVAEQFMPSSPEFAQLSTELRWLRTGHGGDASGKIDKVIVAMEELRWLPRQFPQRYVFINQPAYRVYYYDHGALNLSMKAVIGQQGHQTNFFDALIKTVEFNPEWGVPQSIIRNEMLPHLKRDPSYLDRKNYIVSVNGQQVPSAKVDWSQPLANISVIRPPGPDNALGQLKILFPNSHAIYMHDTPARGKFAQQDRMFSHGCVRLEHPRAMAAAVLGTSIDYVNDAISDGKKKDVPLPEQVPVYISYFTAWPGQDGTVQYFPDIYRRDAETLRALAMISASRANP